MRKPRKARAWKPADLDRLATVTTDDLETADDWWKRNAPPRFKALLDAKPDKAIKAPGMK